MTGYRPENPLIVQGDQTVLVEVASPRYAEARDKFRIASENPLKLEMVRTLLARHPDEPTLVIGMYVDQVKQMAGALGVPVLTGSTPQRIGAGVGAVFRITRVSVLAAAGIFVHA